MFIVLLLAVGSGALAGYTALKLLEERVAPVVAAELPRSTTQIVIAARDLPAGYLLGAEDVRVIDWPSGPVPDGYARSIPEVVGRGLITNVKLNEPLLATKMANRSGQGGLQIVIPEGMRAIAVRVDEVVAVAGFVVPGARVDLFLTTTAAGDPITKLVMQNVTVLAVEQNSERDPQGRAMLGSVVTVLATPDDAEKLIHATRSGGQIQLGLRNMLDVKDVTTRGARMAGLLAGRPGGGGTILRARQFTPTAEQPAQPSVIETYKGGVKALIRF